MLRSPATKAKPTRQRGVKIDHVWMLSYECAGIAQAGGLGEAVAGLARTLSSDYGLRVTVLLPSHGRHSDPRLKEAYGLREETRFIGQGSRLGVNRISYRFQQSSPLRPRPHLRENGSLCTDSETLFRIPPVYAEADRAP